MPIRFQQPFFLLVLLCVPVIWLMARHSFLAQNSRRRVFLVAGMQSLLVVILGLALADPRLKRQSDQVNVLFCLDRSESIGHNLNTAVETFMQQATQHMDADDQAGLIVFGRQPSLELPFASTFNLQTIHSDVNPNFTDIYSTLQFALGKFPPKGQSKIVLLTDGNENLNHAEETAYLAAALNVEIDPVPLTSWFSEQEVYIESLDAPATAPLHTPYEVRLAIISSQASQADLILTRNETLLPTQQLTLKPGKNVFTFADTLPEPGLYLYKAVLNAPNDAVFQNNEGLAFTRGMKKSQILYVTGTPNTNNPFAETLNVQGIELVQKNVGDLTGSLNELLEYNAIILDNISGQALAFTTMENMETYVKDMGGGLLMLGGDQSFGAGLYNNTPIEKALPVFMDVPTELTTAGLCLVFVIDKSSSMASQVEGHTKLDMGKIAAFSSIEMLNPADRVGIIAFDWEKQWIVPIKSARERQAIADELSQLKESGGTNLYPALEDAFQVMQQTEAARKHVIILSDGRTEPADFATLVPQMLANRISVSAVAIGADADLDLMRNIAQWGGGRYYYTDDPGTIPKIFTGETKIVTTELIAEQTMQPTAVNPHEILQGIDPATVPVVLGQVQTYPKPNATIILNTEKGPLLSAWRYGLGRSIAFTSDLGGRWGRAWVPWEHYGQFVAQMVKWVQRKEMQQTYDVNITRQGEQGTFTVDVTDPQRQFLNQLTLKIKALFPDQTDQTILLDQIAPGRYQGRFPTETIGEYYFTLFREEQDEQQQPEVFGFGIPYTDEFTKIGVNSALLERVATLTHGTVFQVQTPPEDLFTAHAAMRDYGDPLWPYFTFAFLFVLLSNVVIRKFMTSA